MKLQRDFWKSPTYFKYKWFFYKKQTYRISKTWDTEKWVLTQDPEMVDFR